METQLLFCNALVVALCDSGWAVAQTPVGLNNKTLASAFSGKSHAAQRVLSKSYAENGAITALVTDEDSDDRGDLESKYVDGVTNF